MVLFNIRNSYILRQKLPKTPIIHAKILLYSSYILGKTWLTACDDSLSPVVRRSDQGLDGCCQQHLEVNAVSIHVSSIYIICTKALPLTDRTRFTVFYFNFNLILPKVNTDYMRQAQVLNIDKLRLIINLRKFNENVK